MELGDVRTLRPFLASSLQKGEKGSTALHGEKGADHKKMLLGGGSQLVLGLRVLIRPHNVEILLASRDQPTSPPMCWSASEVTNGLGLAVPYISVEPPYGNQVCRLRSEGPFLVFITSGHSEAHAYASNSHFAISRHHSPHHLHSPPRGTACSFSVQ